MKVREILTIGLVLAASMAAVAQAKRPPMFDPFFAISYEPERVHFESAPAV